MATKIGLSTHDKQTGEHYRQTTFFYRLFWSWGAGSLHAGFYDRKHWWPKIAMENTNRVLAQIAKIGPDDLVLDAGCGIGGSSVWLAKNTGAKIVGINVSPNQLVVAKKFARENEIGDKVQFLERSYTQTGLSSGLFSVVWALDSVCHAQDKKAFLREAYRVLGKGGRLLVCDGFLTRPREELPDLLRWLLGIFERGYHIGKLVTVDEFRDFLVEAGFRQIKLYDKSSVTRPNWWLGFLICLLCLPLWPLMVIIGRPELVGLGITGIMQPFGELLGFGKYMVFLARE